MTGLSEIKLQKIREIIDNLHSFGFCGPGDDLEEITAVTAGYRHLVVQLQRLAGPILAEPAASRLDSLNVEIDHIYSVYEARPEIEVIILDVEEAIESVASSKRPPPVSTPSTWPPIPALSKVGLEGNRTSIDHDAPTGLVDHPASNASDKPYEPSTVRREARKLETQARHDAWRKEARTLRAQHPGQSERWIAQRIAKLDRVHHAEWETIRKQIRKK